jgi:hypothetical protein
MGEAVLPIPQATKKARTMDTPNSQVYWSHMMASAWLCGKNGEEGF